MAGDIATISLKVNTSDVERGSNELDKFADAAADAAKGADNFGTSGKVAAKVSAEVAREVEDTHRRVREFTEGLKQNEASTKGAAQASAQQQQELRTLLTQINPVTAAFEKLDNMEQQLSRFNAKGLIDSDTFREAARTIQQTREELGRAADARTEEGRAAAAAAQQDKAAAAAKESFLAKLRDQNALYKTSASEAAEYRAAQMGITQEAALLIAALRQQEDATRRDAEQKRLSAQSSRVLKQAIAELEAAERSAAQEEQRAANTRQSFIKSLNDQANAVGKTRAEILELKAAELGVTTQAAPFIAKLKEQDDAWKKGAISAGQYRQAIRQLPAQFTDIATSIAGGMPLWLVLTQQGGQISDSFGGLSGMFAAIQNALFGVDESAEQSSESLSENANNLAENAENAKNLVGPLGFVKFGVIGVAAALAVASVAYYKAFQEQEEFNKSVILTGGYSGVTARQLSSMAYEVAKSTGTIGQASTVLSKLAGAGVSSAVDFQNATQAILDFSDASGESIDSLVKQYSQLSDDPAGGSLALTKNMHYLTAAQYENIAALQAQGDKAGAVAVATDALSGAMTRRAQEIKDSMGSLPKFFNDVADAAKNMWDGVMGLGRDPSDAEKRAKLVLKINSADEYQRRSALVGKTASMPADYDEWKRELAAIDAVGVKKTNNAKLDQGAIDAQLGLNKLMQDGLTPAEKRTKAEKELNRWIQENKKAAAEGRATLFTSQDIDKARAGIANQYKDPKTPRTPKEKAYQDDAGTRELLASQQRLAALKDQVSASATLTSQEQQLSKFTQQIADLKSKTILTADQKSLLARSGEITASLQLEAQLSRENVQREKAVKALKQMQDYTTSIVSKNAQTQEKFGLTTKQAGRVDQETQLDNTFRKQTDGITDPAALSKVTDEYNRAKEALRSGWDQEDANQGDWLAGMNQGIAQFGENASDVFTATGQLAQTTLSDMASMMTTLATTGKANVKDFAKSFLTSIVDIINKLLLAQAVQAAMGWISSSFSAGSGTATAASNSSFSSGAYSGLSFDSGGYTGEGDKLAPAGIVHRGEFVMTKEATSRIGVDNLYSMMRGYADGGLVGGNAGMFGLSGGQSNSTVVQTSVVVQTGNNQQQTSGNSDAIGKAYQQVIDQSVRDGIAKALRPGGLIYNANNSR